MNASAPPKPNANAVPRNVGSWRNDMDRKPGGYHPEERATGGWLGNFVVACFVIILLIEAIKAGV